MRVNEEYQQFKTDMVIDYVNERIKALAAKIRENSLSDNFGNVSIHATAGSDGGFSIMGSFLFDTFIFDSLACAADAGLQDSYLIDAPLMSTKFNNVAIIAMDVYSMLDEEGTRVHSIRYNGCRAYYPKGRNKSGVKIDPNLIGNFNRAANQNYGFSGGSEVELAALIEVMRNLETLVDFKVREITVKNGDSVATSIQKLVKNAKRNGGMDMMSGGLRTMI